MKSLNDLEYEQFRRETELTVVKQKPIIFEEDETIYLSEDQREDEN